MRRFLIASGLLLFGFELVAQVAACYNGDPGYGLPPEPTIVELRSDGGGDR